MSEHAVVIAGGGPAGVMLAGPRAGVGENRCRVMSELASMDEPHEHLAGIISGLDIRGT